jgi:hypothetical protein
LNSAAQYNAVAAVIPRFQIRPSRDQLADQLRHSLQGSSNDRGLPATIPNAHIGVCLNQRLREVRSHPHSGRVQRDAQQGVTRRSHIGVRTAREQRKRDILFRVDDSNCQRGQPRLAPLRHVGPGINEHPRHRLMASLSGQAQRGDALAQTRIDCRTPHAQSSRHAWSGDVNRLEPVGPCGVDLRTSLK